MRRIPGFIVSLATAIATLSSVAHAQAGTITPKSGIITRQSDCDASCQLQGRLNALAVRLDEAEKEIASLKSTIEQNDKQASFRILALESNLKAEVGNREAQISEEEKKISDDEKKIGEYAFRLTSLEGTAKDYKSHSHTLPAGFGLTKQGNFNMVIVANSNVLGRPTSGPEQH